MTTYYLFLQDNNFASTLSKALDTVYEVAPSLLEVRIIEDNSANGYIVIKITSIEEDEEIVFDSIKEYTCSLLFALLSLDILDISIKL